MWEFDPEVGCVAEHRGSRLRPSIEDASALIGQRSESQGPGLLAFCLTTRVLREKPIENGFVDGLLGQGSLKVEVLKCIFGEVFRELQGVVDLVPRSGVTLRGIHTIRTLTQASLR